MKCEQIKKELMQFLQINNEEEENIDLFEKGYLDSFTLVQLLLFIEERYGVKIDEDDINQKRYKSLKDIVSLIGKAYGIQC